MKKLKVFKAMEEMQTIRDALDPGLFLSALVASFIAALFAAWLYRVFYERRGTGSQIHRAFPLLSISITAIFIAVQLSIPLSLGLLGSLSIIRFRTPIKEPEEVGFIMFIIATSISAATFNFSFMLILMVFAGLALLIVHLVRVKGVLHGDGMVVFKFKDEDADRIWGQVEEKLALHLKKFTTESMASRDGETNAHINFTGLKTSAIELQTALKAIEALETVNILMNRPGTRR